MSLVTRAIREREQPRCVACHGLGLHVEGATLGEPCDCLAGEGVRYAVKRALLGVPPSSVVLGLLRAVRAVRLRDRHLDDALREWDRWEAEL